VVKNKQLIDQETGPKDRNKDDKHGRASMATADAPNVSLLASCTEKCRAVLQ